MAKSSRQPAQQGGILGKVMGVLKQAHEQHKDDETTYSNFGDLPAGMEDAVAQLIEAKFDVYGDDKRNAGQPYFIARGVCVHPAEFTDGNGVTHQTANKHTMITIPVCDTTNSDGKVTPIADHVKKLYNELRKLGLDTRQLTGPEMLEPAVAALKKAGPFFKFRTWRGKKKPPTHPQYNPKYDGPDAPEPRTNHDWQGWTTWEMNGQAGDHVEDETPEVAAPARARQTAAPAKPAKAPAPTPARPAPKTPGAPQAPVAPPEPEPDEGAFNEFGGGYDDASIDGLVARATEGDEEAQGDLYRLAEEANLKDEADAAADWAAVGELVKGVRGDESVGEGGDWKPEPGELYAYTTLNPRTKKQEQVRVEVMSVDEGSQTCLLRNVANRKTTYKDVDWADLVPLA